MLRSVLTSDPKYLLAEAALGKLRSQQETLCIAPQNVMEFWAVSTRPLNENGMGMTAIRASAEITAMLRLFRLLPYRQEVLEIWRSIVLAHGVSGKQVHDAHLVAMMQAHSIASILTFNGSHFRRFPGITVLDPAQV